MTKISFPGLASTLLIATVLAASIPGRAQDDGPKTPLAQQMSGIAKDFRSLRKVVNDPAQKAAALRLVKDMKERATRAKDFEPPITKTVPPADKARYLADYRNHIDGLIADFAKLEASVNAADTTGASALLNKLEADKRNGHKKFNPDIGGPGGHRPPPNWAAPPAPAQTGTNG